MRRVAHKRQGDEMPEPLCENPFDRPGPCDHSGCENIAENEVNGWWFCTKHYNEIIFDIYGNPTGDLP